LTFLPPIKKHRSLQELKKISSKLGVKGTKKSGILLCFQKCVDILHQEIPEDFFSVPEKSVFL
jgi:hypothetical protein